MPTPPGEERAVADRVIAELRELGLEVDEDDAGAEIGSDAGNLYCRLDPTAEGTPLFLCSHMDTVPPVGPIEPVVEDGVVRNAGGTILGADNKSAVVAMVETARRRGRGARPARGARARSSRRRRRSACAAPQAFDCARFVARVGLRLRPGRADRRGRSSARRTRRSWRSRSPGSPRTRAWRPRRAARRSPPPRARSPTCASAGSTRRRPRTSGTIQGGVARNIVPDRCTFNAEARSHDEAKLADVVQEMLDACSFAASLTGCEVEAEVEPRLPRLPLPQGRRAGAARRGRRSSAAGTSRPTRSPAAAPTRTSSTCAASPASTSRTGWRRSTPRRSTSPSPTSTAMVDVTLALLEEARAA